MLERLFTQQKLILALIKDEMHDGRTYGQPLF